MIEKGLYAHLVGGSPVSALVGTRVYPLIIPQHLSAEASRMPCVVYNRINVSRQQKFCGTDHLVRSVFQLDCYAPTFLGACAVAAETRRALVDFRGTMGTVEVKATFLEWQGSLVEPDPGLYRIVQRFILWHDENP